MDSIKKYITFDIETTGLRASEGCSVTCICAKDDKNNWFSFASKNEELLISTFLDWLNKKEFDLLISANGRDFDIPFLLIRAYTNGIPFSKCSNLFCKEHFDIINDITSYRISLDNLARLYNFPLKSGNGFTAINLFKNDKLEELRAYCIDDVFLTEKIYLKYMEIKNGA
jgi:predicted PolB exonuclease-like 3'-5' exonuclease